MLKRLLIVFVSLTSSSAYADTLNRDQIRKLVEGLTPTATKYNGQDGVWFNKVDAEKVLEVLGKRVPLALDIIDGQDKQIGLLKESVELYKSSSLMYQDYSKYNQQMLEVAMKSLPDLQPPQLSWYEKPHSTFLGGVVVGITLVVTSAIVLNKSLGK